MSRTRKKPLFRPLRAAGAVALGIAAAAYAQQAQDPGIFGPPIAVPRSTPLAPGAQAGAVNWINQSPGDAARKSAGCVECHKGIENMHASPSVVLGCVDCHGGDATPGLTMRRAHVAPLNPIFWESSAKPAESPVLLNHESPEFIRFINPSDLRVADKACGLCHGDIVRRVGSSMMNHGAMLWEAALYNNGASPSKNAVYGQAYAPDGEALRLISQIPVTPEMTRLHGILPSLGPLPRFEEGQPSNILRVFEKGGEPQLKTGVPDPFEEPGKPARRLSERGLGTLNRIDPVLLNLQKTRLHDPTLSFMGTNDHPGDFRSSGCAACHVIYANDRSPTNSGWWSKYGNQGLSFTADPMISKREEAHPIVHRFTSSIPSSQCITCHMHQGNNFVNSYLGYTWWDEESDGEFMYPAKQHNPTEEEMARSLERNPEASAARGLWGDPDFLERVSELNSKLKNTQFADYHGHGWVFRAVFKKDREGNLLTLDDKVIDHNDPAKFAKAVHLKDVHLAHGMQCADCHFETDVHGNGLLYGETRAATAIECIDCHGTIDRRPSLVTSGNGGVFEDGRVQPMDLSKGSTPWGPRFYWVGRRLFQRSVMSPDTTWEVPQTVDTIDPKSAMYNPKSAYAKTLRRDGVSWGDVPKDPGLITKELAHANSNISCQICHTSWATSCFGCHLPMRANKKVAANKYDGITTRNFTSYNPEVLRDDVFMLGRDATYKDGQIAVVRSSSAVIVGSQNANREWIYSQQQTVSAEGYSGQAANPHFPHTTSSVGTTKNCTDCHLSAGNDNNAWMAQLLGFGTGTVNFFGRYAYVGSGSGGFDAVAWTEREEPQAPFGSHLQRLAYPDDYGRHVSGGGILKEAVHHEARDIRDVALRGEYLYTANGPDGFEVFDVANVDNKGFSEPITSAPVSPLGQRLWVRTRMATSVTLPSTQAVDPLRTHRPENEEQPISPIYGYVYVTDRYEGLVTVMAGTLLDGDPTNNFFRKSDVTRFNPAGTLDGAEGACNAGRRLYVACTAGLEVVDISDPKSPQIAGVSPAGFLHNPRKVAVQFRYAFVTDDDGLKVLDITEPDRPRPIPAATVRLRAAAGLYAARTYLYVADGRDGLAIVDIKNPERARLFSMFNAGGALDDARAVEVGSVNASMYALVADGRNGLRVLQVISPENVPGYMGFSPPPNPKLIASFPTRRPAVAVSRGLDRDRIVDESGGQTVVFGRRGSRPFNEADFDLFLRRQGRPFKVEDVTYSGGKLRSASGAALRPDRAFTEEPAETAVPQEAGRLVRRPQD